MDHSIIPTPWKKFLSELQTLYPSAIIAGGALRDIICDNLVKDIDIYIRDDEGADINKIAALYGVEVVAGDKPPENRDYIILKQDFKAIKAGASVKYTKVDPTYIHQEPNGQHSLLQSFITLIYDLKYNGELYNLMFIEANPSEFVETDFDFGICKVHFDGHSLVVSDEFWYDYENKQLTISGKFSNSQMIHSLTNHRPRLVKKFPKWKVVVEDVSLRTLEDMPASYKRLMDSYAKEEIAIAIDTSPPAILFEPELPEKKPLTVHQIKSIGSPDVAYRSIILPRIRNSTNWPMDLDDRIVDTLDQRVFDMQQHLSMTSKMDIMGIRKEDLDYLELDLLEAEEAQMKEQESIDFAVGQ